MNLDQQISDVVQELQAALKEIEPVRCDPRLICTESEFYQHLTIADQKLRWCVNWLNSMKGQTKTAARRQRALTPWKEHTL
jgi:hypothetical protein